VEIQRFIGRALRNTTDLSKLGRRMINIDCDVLEADGSTRCASFNGAMLSLVQLLRHLVFEHLIRELPPILLASAVSVGVLNGEILVDLDYREDNSAGADLTVVSSEKGQIIEVQTHVEGTPLDKSLMDQAVTTAIKKNREIIDQMKQSLAQ
jgi:ribonuclease PH